MPITHIEYFERHCGWWLIIKEHILVWVWYHSAVLWYHLWTCMTEAVSTAGTSNYILFLLFINDISQFTTDGCLTNLYTDDSMIYASGDNFLEVQQKLQQCVKNISSWYKINRLKIDIDKTKVMLIGSKSQLKSLNVDDFILSYDDTPSELVENAKYLGTLINCDISWDYHVRRLCQSTYYHISLLRRLRRIFPMNLLLQV